MAKRTVVPLQESAAMEQINFAGAKMAEFGRVDKAAGWVTFHCSLGPVHSKGFVGLFERMGWTIAGDKTSMEKLDGTLLGGKLILASKDKLVAAEVDLDFKKLTGFSLNRLELEGRKGKGFRRELRFKVSFDCEDGCSRLESYMMATDNASGSLQVSYLPEAVQTEMTEKVRMSDEQRQAVMEMDQEEIQNGRPL